MFDDPALQAQFLACPPALQDIIREFRDAAPNERIDYMVDFSENLPDLPDRLLAHREAMEQVHECQTPVFLHTEVEEGRVRFFFDVPRESPTVRGYAGILAEGLNGRNFGMPSLLPWAIPQWDVYRHPVQFYEILGILGAISLLWALLDRLRPGQAALLATAGYAAVRLLVDAFRDQPVTVGLTKEACGASWTTITGRSATAASCTVA